MRVLIIGCGYVGMALAKRLQSGGHEVFGVRRPNPEAAREMAGIRPWLVDVTDAAAVRNKPLPPKLDWVASAIAPQNSGGSVAAYEAVYLKGTLNMLEKLKESPAIPYIYISSTSVYAQDDGSVVSEESATEPLSGAGQVLLRVEQELLRSGAEGHVKPVILRSAGIYGPERTYWLRRLQAEPQEIEDSDRVLNMIHRDDLVSAVLAVVGAGKSGEIYNVVDDRPVTVKEMRTDPALRVALPATSVGKVLGTAATVSRSNRPRSTNKRVSNAKLKRETDWIPEYPSYREGFEQLLKDLSAS